jgi:hypothetical protein
MQRYILAILFAAFCAGCARTSINRPVPLTPAMFDGYEFTLISENNYFDYVISGGNVNFSCGQKGGGLVGFTFGWKIKDGNTLVFTEGTSSAQAGTVDESPERYAYSFQFRSFDETTAVTMAGDKFRRSKFKLPP